MPILLLLEDNIHHIVVIYSITMIPIIFFTTLLDENLLSMIWTIALGY